MAFNGSLLCHLLLGFYSHCRPHCRPLPSIAVCQCHPIPLTPIRHCCPISVHRRPLQSAYERHHQSDFPKNICLTTWILCNESCFRATKVFICLTAFGLNKSVLQMFYICCLRFALGSHCPDWDYFLYVFLRWDNFVPKLNICYYGLL